MKQVIFGAVCGVILFFSVLLFLTIANRGIYEADLENAADAAMKSALAQADASPGRMSSVFMAAALKKALTDRQSPHQGDRHYSITVSVAACDASKGLLSARFEGTFTNPLGVVGHTETERTCLLEQEAAQHFVLYTFELPQTVADEQEIPALVAGYRTAAGEPFSVPAGTDYGIGGWVASVDHKRYSTEALKNMIVTDYFNGCVFMAVS